MCESVWLWKCVIVKVWECDCVWECQSVKSLCLRVWQCDSVRKWNMVNIDFKGLCKDMDMIVQQGMLILLKAPKMDYGTW